MTETGGREWRPINDAAKNGVLILLWSDAWEMSWGIQIGHFEDGMWLCGEGEVEDGELDEDGVELSPTHWMPLPEPPTTETPL